MKKGFIKKQISNQYEIIDFQTKTTYLASARGKLRYVTLDEKSTFHRQTTKRLKTDKKITQISPKVGDHVLYQEIDNHVYIEEVLPRINDLTRPDVANVDQVLLVFSAVEPDFSFLLLDRFLIIMNKENLKPVIIISKIDLIGNDELIELKLKLKYYEEKLNIPIYYVNNIDRIGIYELKAIFKDKITVLAGQTGVGKSSLLNAFMPDLNLETQEISEALGRGKHTTRHTELFFYEDGYICDTPGFSKIEMSVLFDYELKDYYEDFNNLADKCRFKNKCLHDKEPNCNVKDAYNNDKMLKSRYENYIYFLEEIRTQKARY